MEFFEKKYFQLNEIRPVSWFDKGSYTNHVDSHGGRGVSEMSTLLIMPKYLVKLSMKGEGALCHEALSNSETKEPRIFKVTQLKFIIRAT